MTKVHFTLWVDCLSIIFLITAEMTSFDFLNVESWGKGSGNLEWQRETWEETEKEIKAQNHYRKRETTKIDLRRIKLHCSVPLEEPHPSGFSQTLQEAVGSIQEERNCEWKYEKCNPTPSVMSTFFESFWIPAGFFSGTTRWAICTLAVFLWRPCP